jgi:hypothetical protein
MTSTIGNCEISSPRGFWVDLLIGFTVFVLGVSWLSLGASEAFPMPPPSELLAVLDPAADVAPFVPALRVDMPAFGPLRGAGSLGHWTAWVALGAAFSSVFAANLALVRHVRHAYVAGDQ